MNVSRKNCSGRDRKKKYNTKWSKKNPIKFFDLKPKNIHANYNKYRYMKSMEGYVEYTDYIDKYIYNVNKSGFDTGIIYDDDENGDTMNDFIENNNIDKIRLLLSDGYDPNSSFNKNCPCCCYEYPDDLTACFQNKRMIPFKLLAPKTSHDKIIGDGWEEAGVRIWGDGAAPFLKFLSSLMNIDVDYLYTYIGYNNDFNVKDLQEQLEAIGKTEDSIDFECIRLSEYNKDYYESMIRKGRLDLTRTLSSIIQNQTVSRETAVYLSQLCIRLGADTSKSILFECPLWGSISRKFNLPTIGEFENLYISLDMLMPHIDTFLDEYDHSEYDYVGKKLIHMMELIKDVYNQKPQDAAIVIQCFIRISLSKKKANDLRSIPENLFDPEFSLVRKKLLNIDDSCFNKVTFK